MKAIRIICCCAAAYLCVAQAHGQRYKFQKIPKIENKELDAFEKDVFDPLVKKLFDPNGFKYETARNRLVESFAAIRKQFGDFEKPYVARTRNLFDSGTECAASVSYKDMRATVDFYLPAIMDLYQGIKSSGDPSAEELFENHMRIMFIREIERIRYVIDHKGRESKLQQEMEVWSRTCLYSLRSMIDEEHARVLPSVEIVYRRWFFAAGESDDEKWRGLMVLMYGKV